jgi:neutral ceramidase
MNQESLFAGVAKVKTTPPLGTRINGDFITHYATQIHDDLFARALILERKNIKLVFVVVDICVMPKDFLDDVKAMIAKELGILGQCVMISSTHTHAAGSVADVHLGGLEPGYRTGLQGLIVEAVRQAGKRMMPAQVAFGRVAVPEHLLCRRYQMKDGYIPLNPVTGAPDQIKTNPFGAEAFIEGSLRPTDPELNYMAVQGLDGQWIGLVANYSLHYVGDWDNGTISADYFGVFAGEVARLLNAPVDFVAMMTNGTSGDVNIWDFLKPDRYPKENFQKSKLIGGDLAVKVFESTGQLVWEVEPELAVLYKDVESKVVKPSADELTEAKIIVGKGGYENLVIDSEGLRRLYAREQLLLNDSPDLRVCPLQIFKIGNAMIGALAGEFFSETGLWLKKNIQAEHYFTITMANGNVGYVPPAEEIALGGYETWRCRYSCLVPGAEKTIRESLALMARRL